MTLKFGWGGLHTVISGGQTGADQAGLVAAWMCGIKTGGTAPKGYETSEGPNFLLRTLGLVQGSDLKGRTKENVCNSNGTVIIAHDVFSPGSRLTKQFCQDLDRPFIVLDVRKEMNLAVHGVEQNLDEFLDLITKKSIELISFIEQNQILNVAGNREYRPNGVRAKEPYMYILAEWILETTFKSLKIKGKIITN